MKPLKILFIINELRLGGAPRLVTDIVNHIADHSPHSADVLTFRNSDSSTLYKTLEKHPTIRLYDLSGYKLFSPTLLRKIRHICRNYDIVHSHLFPGGYLSVLANIGSGLPVVYTEHSTHNRRRDKKIFRLLERYVYSRFAAIGAISTPVAENLSKWLAKDSITNKIFVIPNGINLPTEVTIDTKTDTEKLFGRKGRALLMVSRFTQSKDHAALIKALKLIPYPDVFAVFAGDGETLPACRSLAEAEGVGDKCVFLGARSDIPELIRASCIGVQSSHWEGFGLSAVEMMSAGLPVVVSDVVGLREVVEGAGILFPQGDVNALAMAILSLLDSPQLYEDVRSQCVSRAARYDISATVDAYLNLYQEILKIAKNRKFY